MASRGSSLLLRPRREAHLRPKALAPPGRPGHRPDIARELLDEHGDYDGAGSYFSEALEWALEDAYWQPRLAQNGFRVLRKIWGSIQRQYDALEKAECVNWNRDAVFVLNAQQRHWARKWGDEADLRCPDCRDREAA